MQDTRHNKKEKEKQKQKHLKNCKNQTDKLCEKFVQTQKSPWKFILGSSLYMLHPNSAISNKHILTNFKILLRFTKTKLESVLQQNMVIYQHRRYMKDSVLFCYVIPRYGNCWFFCRGLICVSF